MATIIKSISFQNFYNYYGSFDDNTYHFKEGINIISADNNMGKSKFYNGILWILKDTVYDSDSKQMVSASLSFQKMASGKALNEKTDFDIGVKIVFIENKNKYSVSKIVRFQKNGDKWKTNEKTEVLQTVNNRDVPVNDTAEQKEIIRRVIPVELRNYALLQGESMEKLVDLSSREGLSSTIETLAGIKNLNDICILTKDLSARANNLCKIKEKETDTKDKNKDKLIEEQDRLEERIALTETQIETYKSELSKAKEKRDNLAALQLNAGKREKFRIERAGLLSDINNLKERKKEKEKNITTMLFSENCPWLLMELEGEINNFSKKYVNHVQNLAKQQTFSELAENPLWSLLPPDSPDKSSLTRMLDEEICLVCGREACKNTKEWKHIKKVLERPKLSGNQSKNDFLSFYGSVQTTVSSFVNSIPKVSGSIQEYRDSIDEIDNLIDQKQEEYKIAQAEFLNAGGSENRSETSDKNDLAEFMLAETTINETGEKIRKAEKLIADFKAQLLHIAKELREIDTSDEITKYRDFREMMCSVESIFNNSKERIFDEILEQLEINANRKYSELTKDNRTQGGKLNFLRQADNTVQVSIKNIYDSELTGLGTGFQRMKQLSIVMAIISSKIGNKQFDYPFISDAPFSEFGDNFINNFFEIAPKVFTQSIIMIKELYDPNSNDHLNDLGNKILEKMNDGEIPGTFYVNIIEEKADTTNLVTKNKCYKE